MAGYIISIIIIVHKLKKIKEINFKDTLNSLGKIITCTAVMIVILMLLKLVLPFNNLNRMKSILYIIIYAVLGIIIYLYLTEKLGIIHNLFGDKFSKLLNKFKKKSKKRIKNDNKEN